MFILCTFLISPVVQKQTYEKHKNRALAVVALVSVGKLQNEREDKNVGAYFCHKCQLSLFGVKHGRCMTSASFKAAFLLVC